MAQKGNNILVYRGSNIIAGTRTNDIQTDCDMLEVTNPNSATWRMFKAGRKGWKIDTGFLVLAANATEELLNVGTSYTLQFRDRNGSTILEGTAILKTCKISSNISSLVQGSFSFQGTGALVKKNS